MERKMYVNSQELGWIRHVSEYLALPLDGWLVEKSTFCNPRNCYCRVGDTRHCSHLPAWYYQSPCAGLILNFSLSLSVWCRCSRVSSLTHFDKYLNWALCFLFLCLIHYDCGKQVGSASHKQLTAAQIFHRVRSLSGYSGDPINIVCEVTFVFHWSLRRTIGFMHCSILFTYLFLVLQYCMFIFCHQWDAEVFVYYILVTLVFLNNDVSLTMDFKDRMLISWQHSGS